MIKQLFRTGTRYLIAKWRYIRTGCLAISISCHKNYYFGKVKTFEIAYEKFRKLKVNPVKINFKKWINGNCKFTVNLTVPIETSTRMSYSCYRGLLQCLRLFGYTPSKEHSNNSVQIVQVKVFNFLHQLMSILYPSYELLFLFNLKIPGGCINVPVLRTVYNIITTYTGLYFLVMLY